MEKNPPQQFTKKATPPSESEKKKGDKKAVWPGVILGVMTLIIIGVAAFLYMRPSTPERSDLVQQETEVDLEVAIIDTSDAQAQLAIWLNTQNTQGASFYTQEICTAEDDCTQEGNTQYPAAIWALSQRVSSEGAPASLVTEQTQELVNILTNVSAPWSCHFLYNLATSVEFTFNTEERLAELCLDKSSESTGVVTQQELTKKMQSLIDQTRSDAQVFQAGSTQEEFDTLVEEVSTNAVNIMWSQARVEPALDVFSQALDMYTVEQEEISLLAPRLALASLDMYKATGEDIYLKFAEYVYQLHFSPNCLTLTNCADFLYLTSTLWETTEGEQYFQGYATLTESILATHFDSQGHTQVFNKGALFSSANDEVVYPTRENALVLGTFAQN